MLYLIERFGLPSVLQFFRVNNRDESLDAIRARMQAVFGVSLEHAENERLMMFQGS